MVFKECAICGKRFIFNGQSVYKIKFADKTYNCCSWTCYLKAERVKEENQQIQYSRFQKELKKLDRERIVNDDEGKSD